MTLAASARYTSTSFLGNLVTKPRHLVATSLHVRLRDTFVFVTSRATVWMMTELLALVSLIIVTTIKLKEKVVFSLFSIFVEIIIPASTVN